MDKIIYLDNAATTKPDQDNLLSATKYASESYFNPSSLYKYGRQSFKDANDFKEVLLSNCENKRVVITSGGTESDNTAVYGFAKRGNAVSSQGEHSAVFNPLLKMKEKGVEMRLASLTCGGKVDVDDLLSKIDSQTSFVSVVHVNNETGAINPINQIAEEVKKISPSCIFHSDGVQAFGKLDFKLSRYVDLYSVSAHKIGGIKGIGALIYNKEIKIPPLILGGGQENGLRSGTENVAWLKMFADVYKQRLINIKDNYNKVLRLKNVVTSSIDKNLFVVLSPDDGSPYIVTLAAIGLRGAVLQNMLDDENIIVGTGSACSSKKPFSRIISSYINDKNILNGVIRLSFSPDTKIEDVKYAVERLNYNAYKLGERIK